MSVIKDIKNYFFGKLTEEDILEVKQELTNDEFNIFVQMNKYDKYHSFQVYKNCKKSEILKDNLDYLKLALLHDCGKGNEGFLHRMLYKIGIKNRLYYHPMIGHDKLKNVNLEVAKLTLKHHHKRLGKEMKEFQMIDDIS